MKELSDQRFFRQLSECSQRKVSASDFTEAIGELANRLADFSMDEQDNSVLLRYFSFYNKERIYRIPDISSLCFLSCKALLDIVH